MAMLRRRLAAVALLTCLGFAVGSAPVAADGRAPERPALEERVEVERLQLPVTLKPRRGLSVAQACADLELDEIEVTVGQESCRAVALDPILLPVRYVFVIDESASIWASLSRSWRNDAVAFLERLDGLDSGVVFSFARKLVVRAVKEAGRPVTVSALPDEALSWGTAIHDAIRYALLQELSPRYHVVLIVVTDGGSGVDAHPLDWAALDAVAARMTSLTFYEVLTPARGSDHDPWAAPPGPNSCLSRSQIPPLRLPPVELRRLVAQSGGRRFKWDGTSVSDVIADVRDHLSGYRLLTYTAPQGEFWSTSRVRIRSRDPDCRIVDERHHPFRTDCDRRGGTDKCEAPVDALARMAPHLFLNFERKEIASTVRFPDGASQPISLLRFTGAEVIDEYYLNPTPWRIGIWGDAGIRGIALLLPRPALSHACAQSAGELFVLLSSLGIEPPAAGEVSAFTLSGNGFFEHARTLARTACEHDEVYADYASRLRERAIELEVVQRMRALGLKDRVAEPQLAGAIRAATGQQWPGRCEFFETAYMVKDIWWGQVARELDEIGLRHRFDRRPAVPGALARWTPKAWRDFVQWTRPQRGRTSPAYAALGDLLALLVPTWDARQRQLAFYRVQLRSAADLEPERDPVGLGARALTRRSPTERFLAALEQPPGCALVAASGMAEEWAPLWERAAQPAVEVDYRLLRQRKDVKAALAAATPRARPGRSVRRDAGLEVSVRLLDGSIELERIRGLALLVDRDRFAGSVPGGAAAVEWVLLGGREALP
jgi:hypothetical protein